MGDKEKLVHIYRTMLAEYGCQGWWPVISNKTLLCEYHAGAPRNKEEQFEICLGAILTQNTAWSNVQKALINLKRIGALSPEKILSLKKEKLLSAIRPCGYFNQKAKKLLEFSRFYISLSGRTPSRQELLSVWGIGKETADSMLLYAYAVPLFVVDAYTRRIFSRIGLVKEKEEYKNIRKFFEKNLRKDAKLCQEFHALIVEHAKRHCTKKPECRGCPLSKFCKRN